MPDRPIEYGTTVRSRRRRWPVVAAVTAAVLAAFVWLVPRGCARLMAPKVGVHVPRGAATPVGGLPADATNVSYHLPGAFGPVVAFEFDVPEASFHAWATSQGFTCQRIVEPHTIRRFDDSRAEIAKGYFYRWTEQDRGRYAAYDLEAGRAYYYAHSR